MLPIRKILHPTDFSESSQSAFEFACSLARDYGAELLVLHVVPVTGGFTANGIAVPVPAEEPYGTRAKLAKVRPADHRVRVDHRLLSGDPVEEILKAAKAEKADVIVLGTHGTTGLARLLLGSVAESVLRAAECPVLTIKTPTVDRSAPTNPNVAAAAALHLP